jgi:phosphotransferase system IIB component
MGFMANGHAGAGSVSALIGGGANLQALDKDHCSTRIRY